MYGFPDEHGPLTQFQKLFLTLDEFKVPYAIITPSQQSGYTDVPNGNVIEIGNNGIGDLGATVAVVFDHHGKYVESGTFA